MQIARVQLVLTSWADDKNWKGLHCIVIPSHIKILHTFSDRVDIQQV